MKKRISILFCLVMFTLTAFAKTPSKEKLTSDIFREEGKSVVEIETDNAQGSGVLITKSGIIVTNYHVIHGAKTALARTSDGRVLPLVGIIELDKEHDLALVKVKSPRSFNPIKIGDSGQVKVGERVIAIGNPEGFQNTVSEGIVSGFRMSFGDIYWGFKLIQISAPTSPGSSGGALVNKKGELIGITSAGFVAEAENLNIAVPINYIKPMLPTRGRVAFIAKFAKEKSPNEAEGVSRQFLNTYFYITERLLQSVSGLLAAEQKTLENGALKPDMGFYEAKAGLSEMGSMLNLGLPSSADDKEAQIRLELADILLKMSESIEDFIQSFSGKTDLLANLEHARNNLKTVRPLLFQSANQLLGASLAPEDQARIFALFEKHPIFFRGEVYYGINTVPLDKNTEAVLTVYPDSPAAKAGIKEGNILTAPLDDSESAAYKKQIISIENSGKPQTLFVTPVRFGFSVKPVVIGVEAFRNESISSGAPEAIENLVVVALSRIPNVCPVALPRAGAGSPVQEAAQNGLDYILEGKVTRLEEDSEYSLIPSRFEGYNVKLGVQLTMVDPFGQATACCKPQQIEVHSAFENGSDAYLSASHELVEALIKDMASAGIIKPEPKKESLITPIIGFPAGQ